MKQRNIHIILQKILFVVCLLIHARHHQSLALLSQLPSINDEKPNSIMLQSQRNCQQRRTSLTSSSTPISRSSLIHRRMVSSDNGGVGGIEEFGYEPKDPIKTKRSESWVLVVDDEESIRRAVGQFLYDQGYQVTACPDGESALQIATSRVTKNNSSTDTEGVQKVPDCVVSDIRMPGGMDGIELLQKMRQNAFLVEVPVILLTAKGMIQDRIDGYDSGADAYLSKPFDPDELIAIIDNLIDRHQTLSGANVQIDDLKRDLDEMKFLLLEKGGGGVSPSLGFVEDTNVFLAPDEREILELLCQGLTTKDIAARTYLSTRRVEQLLTRMFRKTNARNRTELVRWAVTTGNVQID